MMKTVITTSEYRINEPDFRAEPSKETAHAGRRCWICTCYEWEGGRWEGFVSITFNEPPD